MDHPANRTGRSSALADDAVMRAVTDSSENLPQRVTTAWLARIVSISSSEHEGALTTFLISWIIGSFEDQARRISLASGQYLHESSRSSYTEFGACPVTDAGVQKFLSTDLVTAVV